MGQLLVIRGGELNLFGTRLHNIYLCKHFCYPVFLSQAVIHRVYGDCQQYSIKVTPARGIFRNLLDALRIRELTELTHIIRT